jgi:hypothetical protein
LRLQQQGIDVDINVRIDFYIRYSVDDVRCRVGDLGDAGRARPDDRGLHP